jgi:hypothetical protein
MQLDQGVAALLGAGVGGAASLLATWWTGRQANRQAERTDRQMTGAAAILLQDDFYHYQATLAHVLDDGCWWDPARLLSDEASTKDVKRCLATLKDDDANTVAGARGWMRVLIQKHGQVGSGKRLSQTDLETVRETFKRLEQGRCSLKKLAGRDYFPFGSPLVLEDIQKKTAEEVRLLAAIDCPR